MTEIAEIVPEPAPSRLSDQPNWLYLLREFYEMYRNGGAGGSVRIRAHQRRVRESISRVLRADAPVRTLQTARKPVLAHLDRALDRGELSSAAELIRATRHVAADLCWLYGYDKVPKGLENRYAFAEVSGPSGPVVTDQIILGYVLFAPGCTYPAHAHDGITESYYVLSGTVSENDDGVYAAGSLIFNPPGRMHRITVGARNPALLAYAWSGNADKLTHQKMVFSRPRRPAPNATPGGS